MGSRERLVRDVTPRVWCVDSAGEFALATRHTRPPLGAALVVRLVRETGLSANFHHQIIIHIQVGVEWSPSNTPLSYTNWYAGQPGNAGGFEDCMQIYSSGKWDDDKCMNQQKYVCQQPH